MIPFDRLGGVFSRWGEKLYPKGFEDHVGYFVSDLADDAKILDVGAGTATAASFVHRARRGAKLWAIDPSAGMLRYAPKYVRTLEGVAEKLPFENESFDGALVCEALHHFNNPQAALDEIWRILRPGGALLVYDFDLDTLRAKAIAIFEKAMGEPANFYTLSDIKEALKTSGFHSEVLEATWRYVIAAKKDEFWK